jgi:hypothetical protein
MNDWLDGAFALPTRDGQDTGGAQERTMLSFAQDVGGIRTVEEINPDGSITRLRTRQGRPTFETDTVRATSGSGDIQLRGFVAQIPGRRAVLFNPYTLEVIKTPYTPAAKLYEVQDFMTETTWYDVVLFDRTTIKVNAKAMPKLGITANHGYEAIPHVINYTVGDQYGNAERNATEKRVFAVGRYSVTSWGGGGVTETLTPTEPRTESRALTVGQRIDGDTAYLGELYHGIDGWDGATEWYFRTAAVQMLLTAAYLVKTSVGANVAMSPPTLASAGTSSGTMDTDTTLPAGAEIALIGSPVITTATPYSRGPDGTMVGGQGGSYQIRWPWTGVYTAALEGTVHASYTRTAEYGGVAGSTEVQSGITLTYSASNSKIWDARNEDTRQKDYNHIIASHTSSSSGSEIGADTTTLWWGQHVATGWDPSAASATRGVTYKDIDAWTISGSAVTGRAYEEQTFSASVNCLAGDLVSIAFSRNQSSGAKATLTPITGYYDPFFLPGPGYAAGWVTIYYYAGVGIGGACSASFGLYSSPASDITPAADYYKQTSLDHQDPVATGEINSMYAAGVAALMGQTYYDSEDSGGHYGKPYYTASINPSVSLDNNSLTWATKDFILYDPTNEVYITIEGSFTGADNVATLTVLLKVQTRHHTTTQTLGEFSYTYGEMLVEREFDTGLYAVPSPQIRAIFAPLYCEQGSFKGAHYVTQAEEDGGIAAFHGFNFVLNLRMYSDFDTCNDDNAGQQVYFVPCNLLEMLYAFVFSTEYGVAEDGTRYPVTYTSRFNEMRDTLFATPVRVTVKDGSATNWTDTFGPDFAAVGTVSLHRT